MNGVSNAADLPFNCILCGGVGYNRGEYGGHSLVQTSCDPVPHVFHLECITRWFDSEEQKVKRLDERQCGECNQKKALPLLRLDKSNVRDDDSPYCESMMFNACRTGDLRGLEKLLSQDETLANGIYRSVTTGHRVHPLAVTINFGHSHCTRALINYHADVNAVEHNGEPPLRVAARLRRTDELKILIDAGADINKLLLFAIQKNEAELLEYLISTQPNPVKLNSALREAVGQGQTQCFKPLVEMGAYDLDGALCQAAEQGQTQCLNPLINLGATDFNGALREAAEQGQTQCLKPLIKMGANDLDGALREAARWGKTQCLELLLNEGAKDLYGAFYIAVLTGNSEVRDVLISKGVDITTVLRTPDSEDDSMEAFIRRIISRYINATDEKGTTPQHIAAVKGHTTRLKELIATREVDVNATDSYGNTALRLAACCGHTEAVKVLLNSYGTRRIQVNAKDRFGNTALHYAAKNGHTKTVKELVKADGINVNQKNVDGWTPLHSAVRYANADTVKELVAAKDIKVNRQTEDGLTPLHIAVIYASAETVQVLVNAKGISVNEEHYYCWRPIHFSARYASAETVNVLLSVTGIKVNEKTRDGWTARDLAYENNHPESDELLRKKGGLYSSSKTSNRS